MFSPVDPDQGRLYPWTEAAPARLFSLYNLRAFCKYTYMKLSRWTRSSYHAARPASEVPITTAVAGLRWHCLGGYHGRLFVNDAPDWTNPADDPRAQLVKENPLRQVYHFRWDDLDVYLKLYQPAAWTDSAKWLLQGPPSRGEFERLLIARRRGVPVAKPVAWAAGTRAGKPFAALITESLGPTTSLEQLIWHEPPLDDDFIHARLEATAQAVARLHCAGIEHRDLHPGNILLPSEPADQPPQAWIADLQGSRLEQRGGHASAEPLRRWRIKNIAVLTAGLQTRLADRQIETFLRSYLNWVQPHRQWQPGPRQDYLNRVRRWADRQDRRIIARHDRRCLRPSRYAAPLQLPDGSTAQVFLQTRHPRPASPVSANVFQLDQWRTALTNLPQILEPGTKLKSGPDRSVIAATLQIGARQVPIVAKVTKTPPGLLNLLRRLGRAPALAQWHKAHQLIARRIQTAWPLAALQQRRHGLVQQSIFLAEHVQPGHNLKLMLLDGRSLPTDPRIRRAAARALGRMLAQLTRAGLRHRDCKASNIIMRPQADRWQPWLIDLDGISPRRWWHEPHNHQALVRLGASVSYLPFTRPRDYAAAFAGYFESLDPSPAQDRTGRRQLRRRLARAIAARAQQAVRKYSKTVPLPQQNFKRVLIIKPSSLGDVARSLPVLQALRQRYPNAHIAWLVRPDCAGLLRQVDGLDEIILFDRRRLGRIWYSYAAARDLIRLCKSLKKKQFDIVLDLQGLFRSGFLSLCSRAPVRLGPHFVRESAGLFYTHRVPAADHPEHASDALWRFVQTLGFTTDQPPTGPSINETARAHALEKLQHAGLPPGQPYGILLVGGTKQTKRWPAERFGALAQRLMKDYDIRLVILGAGSAEAEIAAAVTETAGPAVIDLAGRTNLAELTALLAGAEVVIGNDSGPLHIAAAVAAPTVGLYGPTNPAVVGPYRQMDGVVQAGPNVKRLGRYSRNQAHQISTITVEEVLEAVAGKIKRRPRSAQQ